MKFHFTAIDGNGRVVRGTLRAGNEDNARELLLSENIFSKKLEPADEEEKITWFPRKKILERTAAANAAGQTKEQRCVANTFPTTILGGEHANHSGEAGLTEDGDFIFVYTDNKADPIIVSPDQTETIDILGFPTRTLRVTLISGKMYEFNAGLIFANGSARQIKLQFKQKKGSS